MAELTPKQIENVKDFLYATCHTLTAIELRLLADALAPALALPVGLGPEMSAHVAAVKAITGEAE